MINTYVYVNTDANKPRWFLHITYTHLRIHVYQMQCALYMCGFDNTSEYVSQKPSHSLEEHALFVKSKVFVSCLFGFLL